MAESSCLAMQDFNLERDASPVPAFGESVSFGRFMSESLDWGRWSSFRHNRYLEEVAKYSRPGSVAQKKAFFEAHYKKKLAARKEAKAPLEHSLSMESSADERRSSGETEDRFVTMPAGSTAEVTANEDKEEEIQSPQRSNLDGESIEKEVRENKSLATEDIVPEESPLRIQSPDTVEDIRKHSKVSELEVSRSITTENIPLKESFVTNRVNGESIEKEVQENKSLAIEDIVPVESPLRIQSPNTVEDIRKHRKVSEMEVSRSITTENIPLKESFVTNRVNGESIEKEVRENKSLAIEDIVPLESPLRIQSPDIVEDIRKHRKVSEMEVSRSITTENIPLKESFVTNRVNGESIEKEVRENKSLAIEDIVPVESPLRIQSPNTVEDIRKHRKVSEMEVSRSITTENIPLKESFVTNRVNGDLNEKIPRVLKSKSPVVHRSSRPTSSTSKLSPSQAKCGSSVRREKENKFTPTEKCVMNSTERKRSAANSFYMSTNLSECPKGVKKPSLTKAPSILEKVRQLEARSNSSKDSQDRFPTTKTPVKGSNSIVSKFAPIMLHSRRNRSPTRYTLYGGRRKVVPELQNLSSNCSKVFNTGKIKSSLQIPSTSVNYVTDGRPEKRKEPCLNMEDSLYSKGTKKVQILGKATEKTESGLTKLRQSLCFKARPMPDFSQKFELPKNEIKKIPLTRPRSPKLGKRNNITLNSGSNSSSPPLKSSPAVEFKRSAGRNSRTASCQSTPQHKWRI